MIEKALYKDLAEILEVQKLAYKSEAELYGDFQIPPLTQTLEGIREDFKNQVILKAVAGGKITGSVRAYEREGVCHIGRLVVHLDHQNRGTGKELMRSVEGYFPECSRYSLFTGKKSLKNLYFYGRLGYKAVKEEWVSDKLTLVHLEKENGQAGFVIRQIGFGSDDYKKELELRDLILRRPLGLSIYDDNLKGEGKDYHVGAFLHGELIGVLVLTVANNAELKMRQVAVEEKFRGKKIGSRLVAYSEELAGSLRYKKILLNSRKTAVPFYEKLGYVKTGGEFTEVTIPHFKMYKEL